MLETIFNGVGGPSLASIPLAYVGGVLASLTPCVYPMIPIVIGIIGASSTDRKTAGLTLSVSYALGLSLVYAALGVLAAMTGGFFGEVATSPWSFLIFGNLCLALGAWMMEWINLPLFSSGRASVGKGHAGAFFTGMASGLVAAPCTRPCLPGFWSICQRRRTCCSEAP